MADNYEIRADGEAFWEEGEPYEITFMGETYTRVPLKLHPRWLRAERIREVDAHTVEILYDNDER